MKNPWEQIALEDYENHMQLDTVMQLQAMNSMMKRQLSQYPAKTVMILGVAGGNGLEHINPKQFQQVYAVDINSNYLMVCKKRYPKLSQILFPICMDLTGNCQELPHAELLIANLLVEYIGIDCFVQRIAQIRPDYLSCMIQVNTDEGFLSESPYTAKFTALESIHFLIEEVELAASIDTIGYKRIYREIKGLPNGKMLIRMDFSRNY